MPTAQSRRPHPSSEHTTQKEHGDDDSSFTSNHALHVLHPESRLHLRRRRSARARSKFKKVSSARAAIRVKVSSAPTLRAISETASDSTRIIYFNLCSYYSWSSFATALPTPALSVWYYCLLESSYTELDVNSRASYFPAPHADTCAGAQVRSPALSIAPISIFAAHPWRLHDSRAPASGWIAHAHACAAQFQLEAGPVDTAQCAGLSSAICTILPASVSSARRPAEPFAARRLPLRSAAPHMVAPLLCCLRRFDELPLHAVSDTGAPSGAVFAVQPMLACGMHNAWEIRAVNSLESHLAAFAHGRLRLKYSIESIKVRRHRAVGSITGFQYMVC
ncbi:hypothetical protein B0H13DRAFT_2371088 [Mycena leptocephala]|nr:hypothetical protein B0H13DRAFT_2371088 [Mycena leptocephala]